MHTRYDDAAKFLLKPPPRPETSQHTIKTSFVTA